MKKGLLLAILAMLTSVTLVGCGQKSEEQSTDDSSNTVATEEQKSEENSEEKKDEEKKDEEKKDEEKKDEEKKDEEKKDEEKKDENSQTIDLGEKTIEGESVEGTIYGTGKYRLTKASDRVVVEWVKDNSKNKIEYIFTNDKLSNMKFTATYESEDQAKTIYDSISKNENAKKRFKEVKLDRKSISYEVVEAEWSEIKDYSKDTIFDENKKTFEELEKVDDIKSDD